MESEQGIVGFDILANCGAILQTFGVTLVAPAVGENRVVLSARNLRLCQAQMLQTIFTTQCPAAFSKRRAYCQV
jgi:hypothetical protein